MDKVFPGRSIGDNNLTHWVSVPSVIDLMSRDTKLSFSNMKSLKKLIFCGEPLLERHLEFVFDMVPNAEVINTYGPTEATVCMTSQKMTINNWKNFVNFGTATLGKSTPSMAITLHGGKTYVLLCGSFVWSAKCYCQKITRKKCFRSEAASKLLPKYFPRHSSSCCREPTPRRRGPASCPCSRACPRRRRRSAGGTACRPG